MKNMKLFRSARTRRLVASGTTVVLAASTFVAAASTKALAADPCNPVVSAIVCENSKPGTAPAVWDIGDAGSDTIQGFPTKASVNIGETEQFKVDTVSTN